MGIFIIFLLRSIVSQSINLQLTCSHIRNAKNCLNVEQKYDNNTATCPALFYGYYCMPETPIGQTAVIKCPFYTLRLVEEGKHAKITSYGMDPCVYDPDGNCFNFWPDHDFRGFHDYHEGFAKDSLTNQTCGVIKDYSDVNQWPWWDKFDRDPCREAVKIYDELYQDRYTGGAIKTYTFVNNTLTAETNEQKEYEIRMLKYARMILISGYAVSLVATTLGSFLMLILRRLRCTRIWIHINLQFSFLLRAGIWLFHDIYARIDTTLSNESLFVLTPKMQNFFDVRNITVPSNNSDAFSFVTRYLTESEINPMMKYTVDQAQNINLVYDTFCEDEASWFWCRLYDIVSHYIICTNYFWVLVEGIYLRMLLQRASFGFSMGSMNSFLLVGWGAALVPTFVWTIVNLIMRNDVNCWANDIDLSKGGANSFSKTYRYELITEIPIMISVLINVFIFISVVSIVGSKLRVNVMKRSDFRYRLARSTLALLPLLGIHYVTTMFIKVGVAESRTNLHIVANFINAILTSVQGLLVSIIYCFCNAEVQDELEKTYSAWKLGRDVRDDANRRRSTLSNSQSGGTWWAGQRRRSSMFMGGRASFSFSVGNPVRRSTEQTYIPSESLLSTGRSASIAAPGASVPTSTMRKIKQMFNKDDQRLSSSSVNYGRNSLLNVPNSYEEESAPPAFGAQSFRNVNTMDGIEEENSDEQNKDEEKRREGVIVRPSVPDLQPPTENNDSGYDEKE